LYIQTNACYKSAIRDVAIAAPVLLTVKDKFGGSTLAWTKTVAVGSERLYPAAITSLLITSICLIPSFY